MLEATKTVADGELCAHVAGFAEGLLAPFTFSQLLDRYGIAGINEEVFDEESETCRHHDGCPILCCACPLGWYPNRRWP